MPRALSVDRKERETLTSVPGRGSLLSPFTRRFRLDFALLRGGSRINQHRAGVLSLDWSTEHSVLTLLTMLGPDSGLRNTHRIAPSLCYLSWVHIRTLLRNANNPKSVKRPNAMRVGLIRNAV
jgi:hypothetical protein